MCAVTMEYPYGYTYLTISTDKNETVIRIKEITDQDAVKVATYQMKHLIVTICIML